MAKDYNLSDKGQGRYEETFLELNLISVREEAGEAKRRNGLRGDKKGRGGGRKEGKVGRKMESWGKGEREETLRRDGRRETEKGKRKDSWRRGGGERKMEKGWRRERDGEGVEELEMENG